MRDVACEAEHEDHAKVYLVVFGALLVLTGVTVAVSYLRLPIRYAVPVAVGIACVKGGLVGAYFMHLVSERTLIRSIVGLTFFFFLLLLTLPLLDITGSAAQPVHAALPQAEEPGGGSHVP